jgi:perosamine synthetase
MKKISLLRPFIGKEEVNAVAKTLLSGWITLGPKTQEFEEKFATYVGAPYAIGLTSATAGLHIALKVVGVKKGDEVITTPITFASTVEAILYNDATPVFADVEESTLNMDPASVEKRITKKTKAILVVHYAGQPCDMDKINAIARKYKLKVIEDAAHACGASYGGKKIGGSGNITCFSFHAVKNLATGDGGMITTFDQKIMKELRLLRWMGIDKSTYQREGSKGYSWDYDIAVGGYKYHMNDITASIGIVQLKKLDAMNKKRSQIRKVYDSFFSKNNIGTALVLKPGRLSSHHLYVVKLQKGISRPSFMAYLAEKGISTGVHYKPAYHHPRYKKFNKKNTPVAEANWSAIVSLPMHPGMSLADAKLVVSTIKNFKK